MDLKLVGERAWKLLLKKVPSWRYLAIAAAVAVVGHYLSGLEIVAPLKALTAQLLADLQVISPLNAMGAYYYALTGCSVTFVDGSVTGNCDGAVREQMAHYGLSGFVGMLFWPFVVLFNTAIAVWMESGWMGRVIYLATLPVGGYAAVKTVEQTGDAYEDWTVFGWTMTAVLVPLFAGATALALQWLLILILWIVGQALAAIVWFVTVVAGPFAYVRHVLKLAKEAKDLEEGHATLKGDD